MSFRGVITGDIQASSWKRFATVRPDGMNSRLYNCVSVLDAMAKAARRRHASHLLINGDLFETSDYIRTDVYAAVARKLYELHNRGHGLEIILVLGNHDIAGDTLGGAHLLEALRPVAIVIEEPTLIEGLWIVPWNKDSKKLIAAYNQAKARYLVSHVLLDNTDVGSTKVSTPIRLRHLCEDKYKYVLLSDCHRKHWVSDKTVYLGSPLQHSFGETHEPALWWLDAAKGELKELPTEFPRFHKVLVTSKADLKQLKKIPEGHYARIDLKGVELDAAHKAAEKYGLRVECATVPDSSPAALEEVAEGGFEDEALIREYAQQAGASKRQLATGLRLYEGGK